MHECPVESPEPHVGGPILPPGATTVLIDYLPAARVTDMATCDGPPDMIAMGSPTVFIEYLCAARIFDPTVHGGMIVEGSPDVIIGDGPGGPMEMANLLAQALAADCSGSAGGGDGGGGSGVA